MPVSKRRALVYNQISNDPVKKNVQNSALAVLKLSG